MLKLWSTGDRVIHSGRPEWGTGVVQSAARATQDGKPCQMLTIRFDRAGSKTLSTAFANLVPAESSFAPALVASGAALSPTPSTGTTMSKDDEFALRLQGVPVERDDKARMTRLPDLATDPFASVLDRLKATLHVYRFSNQGGSLLDWAAMQSGLADPMSKFNRHELERFFDSFVIVRDAHLKRIIAEARKLDPAAAQKLVALAPASAQQALRRLDAMR